MQRTRMERIELSQAISLRRIAYALEELVAQGEKKEPANAALDS